MKAALLICGQARYYNQAYPSIKTHIIDRYNPDIYIHTWKYKNNYAYTTQAFYGIDNSECDTPYKISITENNICEYINLYNPLKHKVEYALTETPYNKIYEFTSGKYTKYNYYSYIYSLNECYKLIENKFDYDVYIIIRSDLTILKFPELDDEHIIFPNRFPDRINVVDPMIATIPAKFMNRYTDILDKLDIYYDKGYHMNYEEMTYAHLKESDLYDHVKFLNKNDLQWGIIRKNSIEYM